MMQGDWALKLFSKSVLKQQKFSEIVNYLNHTEHLKGLDIGGDNGVISYLLRQRGGEWSSADLNATAVDSIRQLVRDRVYRIGESLGQFDDDSFDVVVIIDYLEHIHRDGEFLKEVYRVLRPGGEVIINVPHKKNTLLRKLRLLLGQTDERHGHLRPGYTLEELQALLAEKFELISYKTYSRFFSELTDTLIIAGMDLLAKLKGQPAHAENQEVSKGNLVTAQDLQKNRKAFKLYSYIYPVVRTFSFFDHFIPFFSGYKLIVRARSTKTKPAFVYSIECPDIETASDDYAGRFASKAGKWFLQIQETATQKMLSSIPTGSVLDVGGGHAQLTSMLLQQSQELIIHGSALSCSQRVTAEHEAGKLEFVVSNVFHLPFEDKSMDAVLAFRLISHIHKWDVLIAELCRVARHAVILDYPTVRSINYFAPMLFEKKKKVEKNTRNYICFDEKELFRHFNKHGFEITDRYAQFFFPMVLHRMLNRPRLSALLEGITKILGLNRWLGSPVIIKAVRRDI